MDEEDEEGRGVSTEGLLGLSGKCTGSKRGRFFGRDGEGGVSWFKSIDNPAEAERLGIVGDSEYESRIGSYGIPPTLYSQAVGAAADDDEK